MEIVPRNPEGLLRKRAAEIVHARAVRKPRDDRPVQIIQPQFDRPAVGMSVAEGVRFAAELAPQHVAHRALVGADPDRSHVHVGYQIPDEREDDCLDIRPVVIRPANDAGKVLLQCFQCRHVY